MNRLLKTIAASACLHALITAGASASIAVVDVATAPFTLRGYTAAVIDTAEHYAFFVSSSTSISGYSDVAAIDISTFGYETSFFPYLGFDDVTAAAYDPNTGYGYFGAETNPVTLQKIQLVQPSTGVAYGASSGTISLGTGLGALSAVADPDGGYVYFGISDGTIMKIRMSDFRSVDSLDLPDSFGNPAVGVIDTAAGFAYFASDASPASIVKIRLLDFRIADTLTLQSGENAAGSAVIDTDSKYAYFGMRTSPGIVVKIALNSFVRSDSLTLSSGYNDLTSAVIDPPNNLAFFGTNTNPGYIVPVRLSNLRQSTRPAPLTLSSGQSFLRSAVWDNLNEYAYFGTYTTPGLVLKVDPMAGTPLIVTDIADASIYAGELIFFAVDAYGRGMTYQWFRNSVAIPGATTAVFQKIAEATDDGDRYACTVTGSNGSVSTRTAAVTVIPIISVYPNPWRADRHAAPIQFEGLAADSTVKIFNIAAKWVKTLPQATGRATWDLTNDQGERVASGYYFYTVTTRNSVQTKTGKIAVIR